ncbi:MAG TPA: class I SAM-dependent methyltransferase [Methanobacteriaceae archaeon]|nr:class I SAM-dependent methyltransferase [Methanobacteriaceae archaeon]
MSEKKHLHKHGGKSSQELLDVKRVLTSIKLAEGDVFMDAGCGDGFISIEASKMVGSGKVLAVDRYSPSLDTLRQNVKDQKIENLQVIEADLTKKLPLEDATVDLCLMANVLHGFIYNEEMNEVIPELIRILKSDGRLAIVEFKKIEGTPGPKVSERITAEDVKSALKKWGLKSVEEMEVGPYHYAVVLVKAE